MSSVPGADDALIIAAALSGSAEVFVTGDEALLVLESIEGMPVLDPRSILMRLRGLGEIGGRVSFILRSSPKTDPVGPSY